MTNWIRFVVLYLNLIMKYFTYSFFLLIFTAFTIVSCASKKDILYLQDIESYNILEDSTFNDIRVQKNDLLAITVSSTDQKSAVPFNLPVVASSSGISTTVNTRQELQTYLVGEDGYVDFPVLGRISVLNKTKGQVVNELKRNLIKYIKEPIITLRITNFSISVLGEVNRPGSYRISNERVTIFEALSLAGDMTVYGKRKDVLVIRDKEGKKTYKKLDFTSKNILLSPYYYLQQNDVVLVSPNKAQVQSSAFNRNSSIFVSIAGVILSVISIIVSNN